MKKQEKNSGGLQMTVGQRFALMLDKEKLTNLAFSEIAGMSEQTVSNIKSGGTKWPKYDFWQVIARHFRPYLLWLLLGDSEFFPAPHSSNGVAEPRADYGKEDELSRLLRLVEQQAETISKLAKLVNEVPALRERLQELERRLSDLEK